jgi:hypothetical protein
LYLALKVLRPPSGKAVFELEIGWLICTRAVLFQMHATTTQVKITVKIAGKIITNRRTFPLLSELLDSSPTVGVSCTVTRVVVVVTGIPEYIAVQMRPLERNACTNFESLMKDGARSRKKIA